MVVARRYEELKVSHAKYKNVVMENIKLQRLEAFFYEINHPEIFNFFEQRRLRREIRAIAKNLSPMKTIALDIASGTGNVARHLQSFGLEVVACDLSFDMLKRNDSRYRIRCDVGYLPFKSNSFNLITTYSAFHHFPDFTIALKEICRVSTKSCILYFDHDPFIKGNTKTKCNIFYSFMRKLVQIMGWWLWLLTKPIFWIRFFRYLVGGRRRHLRLLRDINTKLTEINPLDADEISKILRNNLFVVQVKKYGITSLIRAKRKI